MKPYFCLCKNEDITISLCLPTKEKNLSIYVSLKELCFLARYFC